jgi:hypothetical protein
MGLSVLTSFKYKSLVYDFMGLDFNKVLNIND